MRQVTGFQLWVGHSGDARDLHALFEAGIRAVVDLAGDEPPTVLARDLAHCRFPLVDGGGNAPWLLRAAVDAVAGFVRSETPALIHCGAGMTRAPMIAAAAIARVRGCSFAEAVGIVAQSGPADLSPGLLLDLNQHVHQYPEIPTD